MDGSPLVIGFGYAARSGKGECAQYLASRLRPYKKVLITSFAKALRTEIHAFVDRYAQHKMKPQEALRLMCKAANVEFDEAAPVDELNPHGKQRRLQQWYGTEHRRAQDPDYWLKKVEQEAAAAEAEIIIIDDVRFPNEFDWVATRGVTVHVCRPDLEASQTHSSEVALLNHTFDHTIQNTGSLADLHEAVMALYDEIRPGERPDDADQS